MRTIFGKRTWDRAGLANGFVSKGLHGERIHHFFDELRKNMTNELRRLEVACSA
jgi:hypothetical protein